VSRPSQGRSGLGIDAQRKAIRRFAEAESLEIIGEHTEIENAARPWIVYRLRIPPCCCASAVPAAGDALAENGGGCVEFRCSAPR
jgi:hypothetical protein